MPFLGNVLDWLLEVLVKIALRLAGWLWVQYVGRRGFHSGGVFCVRSLGMVTSEGQGSARVEDERTEVIRGEIKNFMKTMGRGHLSVDVCGTDLLFFLRRRSTWSTHETLTRLLALGIHLQTIAGQNQLQLAMALDWEDNAKAGNIGYKPFVVGRALNRARLLTSQGGANHFFLSKSAHGKLEGLLPTGTTLGSVFAGLPTSLQALAGEGLSEAWESLKCNFAEFTFYDGFKKFHQVHSLFVLGNGQEGVESRVLIGSREPPRERVTIQYRKAIDDPQQEFIERLVDADKVCIIGLTNEHTAEYLEMALEKRKKRFWDDVTIVFPSKNALAQMEEKGRGADERIDRRARGVDEVMKFLTNQAPRKSAKWRCLEYDRGLPFYANKFEGRGGASIRMGPILGADLKKTFYVECFQGLEAYKQLDAAIAAICARSIPIMEWLIYANRRNGPAQDKSFLADGIVSKTEVWNESREDWKDKCFPAIIVVLYTKEDGELRVHLQERDYHNSSTNLGKLSNISGYLIDRDVYAAAGKDHIEDYKTERAPSATAKFWEQMGEKRRYLVPDAAWECAAVREIKEELGIEIDAKRLEYHRSICFGRKNCTECQAERRIFFRIYSLELDQNPDEAGLIEVRRPYARLSPFSLQALKRHHQAGELNSLLQTRFDTDFTEIFTYLEQRQS